MSVETIAKETNAHYCYDCTICTGSCPVSRYRPQFSPRLAVRRSVLGKDSKVVGDPELWSCLTCGTCLKRCPLDVDFPNFVRRMRAEAVQCGNEAVTTHHGLMQVMSEIQASGIAQDKHFWVEDDFRTSKKGTDLLYVGCLPFYGIAFEEYELDLLKMAKDGVRVLNGMGIEPMLSPEERCCGHDQFWRGEFDKFKRLAELNIEAFKTSGAKRVIFLCPEGYQTVKEEYPKHFGDLPFEPVHIVELIDQNLESFSFSEMEKKVTYHDSCRMGRFLGLYDPPRRIISSIPKVELVEIDRGRSDSICCGAAGWVNCFSCSKQIQTERLASAKATGADLLLTSCPKCQIHFKCAMRGGAPEIEMMDLVSLVASALK